MRFPGKPILLPNFQYAIISSHARAARAKLDRPVIQAAPKPTELRTNVKARASLGETAPLGMGLPGSFIASISLS